MAVISLVEFLNHNLFIGSNLLLPIKRSVSEKRVK